MTPLAAFALAGCLAIQPGADRITAGDLASLAPALASLPADTPLGFAPAPGATRVFRLPELRMLAARAGTAAPEHEICVTRTVARPGRARLLAAMQRAMPGARIEILETNLQPAPEGEIEFTAAAVRPAPGGALWTGYIRYAGNRRFAVWARVSIWTTVERVVAAADLPRGRPVAAEDVRLLEREEVPAPVSYAGRLADVVGKSPRQAVRAGAALRLDQLDAPKAVEQGEVVAVEVVGAATLKFEARAERSGALGESIPLVNPASHKRFQARVAGKGLVRVTP